MRNRVRQQGSQRDLSLPLASGIARHFGVTADRKDEGA
jgi:hypothetical protein